MPAARMHLMIALSVIGTALTASRLSPPSAAPGVGSTGTATALTHQAVKRQPKAKVVTLPVAREAEVLNSPDHTAAGDLATISLLLSCYRRHHHGNPVGANEEITAALLGKNLLDAAYLPAKGSFLDNTGQLIDRWGTPYFFHALACDRMEIRSAGPDGLHWTPDDVIHRPGD